MTKFPVSESGNGPAWSGDYDFSKADLWLPQTDNLAGNVPSGTVQIIIDAGSGSLYVRSSGNAIWDVFNLIPLTGNMPPDDATVSGALVSWLAPTPGSKTLNGSGVDTWTADFGGNNVGKNADATRPSVASGIQNGLEAIYFDGTDYLEGSFHNLFTGSDLPCSVIVVVRNDVIDDGNFQSLFGLGSVPSDTPLFEFGINSVNEWLISRRATDGTNSFGNAGGAVNEGTWQVIGFQFDGTTGRIYEDAIDTFDSASGIDVNTMGVATLSIGAIRRTARSDFWKGMIGEMAIYTSGLSPAQMVSISRFLKNKWGIA